MALFIFMYKNIIFISKYYLISDCLTSVQKLGKYNSSVCAGHTRDIQELRELVEDAIVKLEQLLLGQQKLLASQMADKLCIDYHIPFGSNDQINEFMAKDKDYHRRKLALREFMRNADRTTMVRFIKSLYSGLFSKEYRQSHRWPAPG